MPGLEGDLEEWQTLEVNVTRGKPKRSMSPEAKPRVTLTSRVCHSSRSPDGPGIICFVIPNSSIFRAHINIHSFSSCEMTDSDTLGLHVNFSDELQKYFFDSFTSLFVLTESLS